MANITLEREYIVPLRRKWKNTPEYKRVPKAIKTLKQFIAKHMKVEERNIGKVKIDKILNEEMWFRGIRRPPAKIKVKATKFDDGSVNVELSEIPQFLKWKVEKEKKKEEEMKKSEEAKKAKVTEKKEGKPEEKKEEEKKEKEKEKSVEEQGEKVAKKTAKQQKHVVKEKKQEKKPLARKTLQK